MSEAPTLIDAGRHQAAGVAVARMYERHARRLYGLCRMLLRDPHEAEDALQATFLAAHAALLRGGVPRDEAAWIATIARNECRGRIRETMRRSTTVGDSALEAAPDPGPGPDERLSDPEVKRALAQLSEAQREAVVLHDVLGLRAREVGTVLGMSVPAVEALLFRARRQLRMRLRPAHGALVVPLAVHEALGVAIPGFATSDAAAAVAGGAGIAGVGILGKLAGAPAAAKIAAGVAAMASAGSVVAVESSRDASSQARPVVVQSGLGPGSGGRTGPDEQSSRRSSTASESTRTDDRSERSTGEEDDGPSADGDGSGGGDGSTSESRNDDSGGQRSDETEIADDDTGSDRRNETSYPEGDSGSPHEDARTTAASDADPVDETEESDDPAEPDNSGSGSDVDPDQPDQPDVTEEPEEPDDEPSDATSG